MTDQTSQGGNHQNKHLVAVIGAGPAGIYAAQTLASESVKVVLINRDIKPGGLAEYGIYPTKERMKKGLRKQFRRILSSKDIEYFGNVNIGEEGELSLDDLQDMGFQALLVTVGAQGTKWLGLPGEDLNGVYHAKDLVYHYNKLPPFSQQTFTIGKRAALIGVGNVMIDIAHWFIRALKIDEVIAVARRGPAEVKFTKKEFEIIANNLDLDDFEKEFQRTVPIMEAVHQDVEAAKNYILSALEKALPPVSDTRFRFDFLASPSRIIGDEDGNVIGLEVEETVLVPRNSGTKAQKTGKTRVLNVDTVVFCIGDRVDESFGLPVSWNEFAKNPNPRFPKDGLSYEAYDPEKEEPLPDVFLAGWAREASSGLVGAARKDGTQGANAVLSYLETNNPLSPASQDKILHALQKHFEQMETPVVSKDDWQRLDAIEEAEAKRLGLESFRFANNKEMLEVMELDTLKETAV